MDQINADNETLKEAAMNKRRAHRARFAFTIPGAEERRRRKEKIRSIHIGDEVFLKARDKFNDMMLALHDDEVEAPALVFRGPSGVGKSHTLKHLADRSDLKPFTDEFGVSRPLLYVRAPAPCNLSTLGAEIYFKLTGRRLNARLRSPDIWSRVRAGLYNANVSVLMLDEMHHAFQGKTAGDLENLMATVKCLLLGIENEKMGEEFGEGFEDVIGVLPDTINPHPIGIVMAGLPHLKRVIEKDFQLLRRCVFCTIKPLGASEKDEKKLKKFLAVYADRLGFVPKPDWTNPDLMLRFRKASGGYRGRMAMLIKNAANLAINRGLNGSAVEWNKLLAEAFDDIYEVGDVRNPFLVADAKKIGPLKEVQRNIETLLRGRKTEGLVGDDEFEAHGVAVGDQEEA